MPTIRNSDRLTGEHLPYVDSVMSIDIVRFADSENIIDAAIIEDCTYHGT
jgi:hypothetical protein